MDKKLLTIAAVSLLLFLPAVYGQAGAGLDVKSTAFTQGGPIPVKYTCDGKDISPPISWSKGPATTGSYALIVDDPDAPAGTFTHWVIFNIPSTHPSLDEGVPVRDRLADGSVQGKNDFGKAGYSGPCPPGGKPHHYRFHAYALDTMLSIGPGVSKAELQRAMGGHILAEGELVGTYRR